MTGRKFCHLCGCTLKPLGSTHLCERCYKLESSFDELTSQPEVARDWLVHKLAVLEDPPARHGAVHGAFGLTYASFLVLPRVFLQAMPKRWQRALIDLVEELNKRYPWEHSIKGVDELTVLGRSRGRFVGLPSGLTDYRRPNLEWVEPGEIEWGPIWHVPHLGGCCGDRVDDGGGCMIDGCIYRGGEP